MLQIPDSTLRVRHVPVGFLDGLPGESHLLVGSVPRLLRRREPPDQVLGGAGRLPRASLGVLNVPMAVARSRSPAVRAALARASRAAMNSSRGSA